MHIRLFSSKRRKKIQKLLAQDVHRQAERAERARQLIQEIPSKVVQSVPVEKQLPADSPPQPAATITKQPRYTQAQPVRRTAPRPAPSRTILVRSHPDISRSPIITPYRRNDFSGAE